MSTGFLQIHDPLRPQGRAVGIDLGTTNSLVAAVTSGGPQCVAVDEAGSELLPSIVHYRADGSVIVGQPARAYLASHPTDTLKSVKRFMGRPVSPEEARKLGNYKVLPSSSVVRFEVSGGTPVTPIEVSGEILRTLKRRAEAHFSSRVEQAVITVPAYFDEAQRQATKDAGRLAGLEVLRLLNEPTAAALAYGLDQKREGLFAVYDLGGGTFDISILQLVDGVFEVKSTGGDAALGGDDFDRALADAIIARTGHSPTPSEFATLLEGARRLKETLSTETQASLQYAGTVQAFTRDEFDALIAPLVRRTETACRRALKDAGVEPGALSGVVLVGGATRVPFVRTRVAALFGQPPLTNIDPDRVVAYGAAVLANLLTSKDRQDDVLLLDVIPLSLGLETMGGLVEKLIHRNTTIPAGAAQVFTTFEDGQTGIDLHVVQGERELATDCRSLARFKLQGIPPMAAGIARVEVRFQIDANGLLTVTAREESSGVAQSVRVQPTHGLTEEEMEEMLLASVDHAEDDVSRRLLKEQQVDAETFLRDARKQLAENGDLLDPAERAAFEASLRALEALKTSSQNHLELKNGITAADEAGRPFVERILNRALSRAVVGRTVEEVNRG